MHCVCPKYVFCIYYREVPPKFYKLWLWKLPKLAWITWPVSRFLSSLLVLHCGSTGCGTLYSKYLMIASLSVCNEALTCWKVQRFAWIAGPKSSFLSCLLVLHWGSTGCGTLYSKYLMITSLSNILNEFLTRWKAQRFAWIAGPVLSFLSGLLVLHWGSTRCGTLYSKYLMIASLSNILNEVLTRWKVPRFAWIPGPK